MYAFQPSLLVSKSKHHSPSGHEGQHDQGIPETVVVLKSCFCAVALFGQTKDLEVHNGSKQEQHSPKKEEVANGRETRTRCQQG